MECLKNRIDFVYMVDVKDGNPNGDPDSANSPRIDFETGEGLITDICLKRKVRNYIQLCKQDANGTAMIGFDIYIKEKSILENTISNVYDFAEVKNAKKEEKKEIAKHIFCRNYYDIRSFGAVIASKDKNDQVRGPIQLTFARSVDPIQPRDHSITRVAEQSNTESGTMGRKATVPYGLYVCHGFISANLAKQTGFSEEDLSLFFEALQNMFDVDRSAARGLMSAQKLIVFRHDSVLGNAPANKLFDLVKIEKKCTGAPRSFSDYEVTVTNCPYNGVTIEELI